MVTSLVAALIRVLIFWYALGLLILFVGPPSWVDANIAFINQWLPFLPTFQGAGGWRSALSAQKYLLTYWTMPMLAVWLAALIVGGGISEIKHQLHMAKRKKELLPRGEFYKVKVASYSIGELPMPTVPSVTGTKVKIGGLLAGRDQISVKLSGATLDAYKLLSETESALFRELIELLAQEPGHFAGLGHGVGLLEHTLNVVEEAAPKCTAEFRLPLLAALAHDIGKRITFTQDDKGEWVRKGLHSRESARMLVRMPSFAQLSETHQRAMLLAVQYDHNPKRMPVLAGDAEAKKLALTIIHALSESDKAATAGEKDRLLKTLNTEELIWDDFVEFFRAGRVVQAGVKGVSNQINIPNNSDYIYLYENAWRTEAIARLPDFLTAPLDELRRDTGKLAKYTEELVKCLISRDLLVMKAQGPEGEEFTVPESNPLWDITSSIKQHSSTFRGVLVMHADRLWEALGYRISTTSPFKVAIAGPNAGMDGRISKRGEPETPLVGKAFDTANPAEALMGIAGQGDAKKTGSVKRTFNKPPAKAPEPTLGLRERKELSAEVIQAVADEPVEQQGPDAANGEAALIEAAAQSELEANLAQFEASVAPPPELLTVIAESVAMAETPSDESAVQSQVTKNVESAKPEPSQESTDESRKQGPTKDEIREAEDRLKDFKVPVGKTAEPKGRQVPKFSNKPAIPGLVDSGTAPVRKGPARRTFSQKAETPVARESTLPKQQQSPPQAKKQDGVRNAPANAEQKPGEPPAAKETKAPDPTPVMVKLSMAERTEGLKVADSAAVAAYPHLSIGDVYYPKTAGMVLSGAIPEGAKYR